MTASFLQATAETCQKHLLQPKWLISPSLRIANQWKEQICRGGINTINLRSATLRSLVLDFSSAEVAGMGFKLATTLQCTQVMASVMTECLEKGKLQYFSESNSIEQLAKLLYDSVQDLRLGDR